MEFLASFNQRDEKQDLVFQFEAYIQSVDDAIEYVLDDVRGQLEDLGKDPQKCFLQTIVSLPGEVQPIFSRSLSITVWAIFPTSTGYEELKFDFAVFVEEDEDEIDECEYGYECE